MARLLLHTALLAHVRAHVSAPPPHLSAFFSTVERDVDNVTAPVVSGKIPSWLRAVKYNNGFGKYEGKGFALKYLFDVIAFINKWRVADGAVTFSSKLIQSEYLAESAKSVPLYRTFGGVEPPMSAWQKARTVVSLTSDNYNVNVQKIGDHLLAISDMAGSMEIDLDTIGTKGPFKWSDELSKRTSMITCAHPAQLPGDKYSYNYLVSVMGNFPHVQNLQKYELYRIDTTKEPLSREVVLIA